MADDFQYDVFLSHNAKDKPRVRRLAERLKQAGLRVWFDEWNVGAGDIIALKVDEGLEQSRVLLLCISPAALDSGWVALERSTAVHRDPTNAGRRFIPLLLGDCDLPDTLRRYKYVDFREDTHAAFTELLSCVREVKTEGEALGTKNDRKYPFVPKPYSAQDVDDASKLKPKLTNGCGIDFVLIRGGSSIVRDASDGTQREVLISPFYLAECPITNQDFNVFIRKHFDGKLTGLRTRDGKDVLRHWTGDRLQRSQGKHPVTFVSWRCAIDYGDWLQEVYPLRVGPDIGEVEFKYRLPTEAEWEFAARGGRALATYPWGDDPPSKLHLNYDSNKGGTTGCKQYLPNSFGLYDMAGNVGEWCLDDFSHTSAPDFGTVNPCCYSGSELKVMKGGSWRSREELVRLSFRDRDGFMFCDEDVGFRLASEVTFRR